MPGSQPDPGVTFTWIDRVDADLTLEIRRLFNASLEIDDMIGFPGPIADDDRGYFEGLRFDVDAGRKRLLVGRAADGMLIAMAVLTRNGMPNCDHLAEVSKCIIAPSRRGRGILAAGLRELLAYCTTSGIEVLTLDVRKGTRAAALWQAVGFRPFGELPDYARTAAGRHAGVYLWAAIRDLIDGQQARVDAPSAAASAPAAASTGR